MPTPLTKFDIVYHPVPKVACTSIKTKIYEIEHGDRFQPRKTPDGRTPGIHGVYPTKPFHPRVFTTHPGAKHICVIRDPVDRLLSVYENRVAHLGVLGREKLPVSQLWRLLGRDRLSVLDLRHDPDPDNFFERIDAYIALSPDIRHHAAAATTFLGPSLDRFDRVFRLEHLDALTDYLEAQTGRAIRLPHTKKSRGRKPAFADLSDRARGNIMRLTMGDYALVGAYYDVTRYFGTDG